MASSNQKPQHIAIIMDGNGRWAQLRGKPRIFGHRRGVDSTRDVVRFCSDEKIPYLTLYTFSSENWKRPAKEVEFLMNLISDMIDREIPEMMMRNVRMKVLGDWSLLPKKGKKKLLDAEAVTAGNTGMFLSLAISYGGRQELVLAAQKLAQQVAAGELAPEAIDEEKLAASLYLPELPDVDLMIRTGGEYRTSNYLPWQAVYAELFFTPALWPDFGNEEMYAALDFYGKRERRFGGVMEKTEDDA